MGHDDDFTELMRRARTDDPAAIRDFLARFEREVQMMVRARLPKKLRTQFDSVDFVQAVWQSFFSDLRENPRDFANTEHLRGFLAGVVRNKVQEQHRRLTRTEKYDVAREQSLYIRRGDREFLREVVSPEPSPSEMVQADDRMAQMTAGRSPREIEIVELRLQGLTFVEIAARTRMDERAVRRVIESVRSRMEARS